MNKLFSVLLAAIGILFAASLANAVVHEWINKQGASVNGTFLSSTDGMVTISIDGAKKPFTIKLSDLSPKSQALAKKLEADRQAVLAKKKAEEDRRVAEIAKLTIKNPGKFIAEAINEENTQKRNDVLYSTANPFTPYTGWVISIEKPNPLSRGGGKSLHHYKDGKKDGPYTSWWANGRKNNEGIWGNGEVQAGNSWWWTGQLMDNEFKNKDGSFADGTYTYWYPNGNKKKESTYKDGKCLSNTFWTPHGRKCPYSTLLNGNGVLIMYNIAPGPRYGRQLAKSTLRDGKVVDTQVPDYKSELELMTGMKDMMISNGLTEP